MTITTAIIEEKGGTSLRTSSLRIKVTVAVATVLATALTAATASAQDESTLASSSPSATDVSRALSAPVVFNRSGYVYRIDPGVAGETRIREVNDAAILSPDGTAFLDFAPTNHGSTPIFAVDGSGYRVLPDDPTHGLPGGIWSDGGERVVTEGWTSPDPHGVGLWSRRSSDGGDLRQLTDPGDRHDLPIRSSPDGSLVVFIRPDAEGETDDSAPQDVFVVSSEGGDETKLSPPGKTTVYGFETSGFSPDGDRIALVLADGSFWDTPTHAVYVGPPDGTGVEAIGPVGAILEVAWSPDGEWIAFTMSEPEVADGLLQLYLMRPDGTDVHQVTDGSDGRFSLQPVWSPDGTQILLKRGDPDSDGTDLWVVDVADGALDRVTDQTSGYGAMAWLPSNRQRR